MPGLRNRLKQYGLDGPTKLAKAIGTSKQYAHQLLRGDGYGVQAAERIAKAVDLPWHVVYEWQRDGR